MAAAGARSARRSRELLRADGRPRPRLGVHARRRGARARRARGVATGRSSSRTSISPRRASAGSAATSSRASSTSSPTAPALTLHVRLLEGDDPQHVLEAIFKALGVALGAGVPRRSRREGVTVAGEDRRPHRAAPAPFQGAPYSQAIGAGGLVFVSGQLGAQPGDGRSVGAAIDEQTEQVFANLGAILEAAGSGLDRLVKTTVFLTDLGDFAGDERGLRAPRRRQAAGARDGRGRGAALGRARRDRGDRARSRRRRCGRAMSDLRIARLRRTRSASTHRLVGGAVRDELLGKRRARTRTSSSRASATPSCARRSSRTAGSRTSIVAGQRVGVRLLPARPALRALAPAGIEFAPPRRRALDRAGPPRLRDRRRRLDLARAGHGAPRLHDQRDREAARDR